MLNRQEKIEKYVGALTALFTLITELLKRYGNKSISIINRIKGKS